LYDVIIPILKGITLALMVGALLIVGQSAAKEAFVLLGNQTRRRGIFAPAAAPRVFTSMTFPAGGVLSGAEGDGFAERCSAS